MAKKKKKKSFISKFFKQIIDIGFFILIVLVITLVVKNYVLERVKIHNFSMEETLEEGDIVLVDKLSYRFIEPERFDVIVFKQNGTGEEFIKRVIGLPHERVQIISGTIYINGEEIKDYEGLEQPLEAGIASSPITLSEGEYFVLGDNRVESIDSRYSDVGNVTSTRIIGKAFVRIQPLSKLKFL